MEVSIPVAGSASLLKTAWHIVTKFNRNMRLNGFYLVHYQNQTRPVVTSPEQVPNFLKMDIKWWWSPDTLKIRSKDYDKKYAQKWKTWIGKITLHSDDYGTGWYRYLGIDEPGNHEIWPQEDGSILVRVVDKGKANLREHKDNDPATQRWVKVQDDDPRIHTFDKMLHQ